MIQILLPSSSLPFASRASPNITIAALPWPSTTLRRGFTELSLYNPGFATVTGAIVVAVAWVEAPI